MEGGAQVSVKHGVQYEIAQQTTITLGSTGGRHHVYVESYKSQNSQWKLDEIYILDNDKSSAPTTVIVPAGLITIAFAGESSENVDVTLTPLPQKGPVVIPYDTEDPWPTNR